MTFPPGLLISAPSSGAGKTTVMLGLLRALRDTGLTVQPFKSGPDYIDPAFHFAASGRRSYNLDSWAMPAQLIAGLVSLSADADLCLAEGSMGLFDGVAKKGQCGHGSSAETAIRCGWPVVLVLDIGGQAQSAAATALGFMQFQKNLNLAGVILNRVASPRHERLARLGMDTAGIEVLGVLPRRGDLTLPERHLGLIQAVEHPDLDTAIANYAAFVADHIDLTSLEALATATNPFSSEQLSSEILSSRAAALALPPPPGQHVALARDEAFSFTYPHILKHWRDSGAELSFFSPLADAAPDSTADVIWLPGGYPELYADRLAAAQVCFSAIRAHAETRPVHGECGGYMVLGKQLIDKDGKAHDMLGLLGLVTSYADRKFHLGYRLAEAITDSCLFGRQTKWRGHEFHYSSILDQPDTPLFSVADAEGAPVPETGSVRGQVSGTFFHMIAGTV